ncbi:DUF937 domain-containing protein [Millisia brevis]|uniref:DUF937 domain-containing protein n=1 Tax=Millisia brevis TaxID=264148 RepID=UPI00083526A3|nr:DUF937 domain-containing protein [Millisia brevis]
MSEIDDLISRLPIAQIAGQLGVDTTTAQAAVNQALPALLLGLKENAADEQGAKSLATALTAHDNNLAGDQIDLSQIDTGDGQKIVGNIFGSNENQVISALGNTGAASSGLIQKLLPILAPIVLSYLAGQVSKKAAGSGGLGDILAQALGGAAGQSSGTQQASTQSGGALGDLLGSVLGSAINSKAGGAGAGDLLGSVLGGLLGGGKR